MWGGALCGVEKEADPGALGQDGTKADATALCQDGTKADPGALFQEGTEADPGALCQDGTEADPGALCQDGTEANPGATWGGTGILYIDEMRLGLEAQYIQVIRAIMGNTLVDTRVGTGVGLGVTLAHVTPLHCPDEAEIGPGVSAHPLLLSCFDIDGWILTFSSVLVWTAK